MTKSFVIIDESKVNSYGFRTLVDGVDYKQYNNNPILLWMHTRAFRGTKDDVLPIGKMTNIRVEGAEVGKKKLVGDPVFDQEDAFAAEIARKVENEFIRMASAGLDPRQWSDDAKLRLPGQTGFTLSKSKLFEVSIVDIGSDDGALALWKDGNRINLSSGGENKEIPNFNNNEKEESDMKTIALKLGLPETASEQEILSLLSVLLGFKTENETLKKELNDIRLASITGLVDGAINEKRITADKKEHFIQLGESMGVEYLKTSLSMMQAAIKPMDMLNLGKGTVPGATMGAKKLGDLKPKEMIQLRKENPDEYKELYKAEYGCYPQID